MERIRSNLLFFSSMLCLLYAFANDTNNHYCAKMEGEHGALVRGDKLILKGLMFYGFHGTMPEERKLGQKFLVDLDAWMNLSVAGKSDNLSDTASYVEIYNIVKKVLEGSTHNLLESVAEQIANTTLTKQHKVCAVRVKIGKPHVAVPGPLDSLGVEILRHRSYVAN